MKSESLIQATLEEALKTNPAFRTLVTEKGGIREFNKSAESGMILHILEIYREKVAERLLEEIEKEKKNYKEKQEWKDSHQEFYEGVWHGLEIARALIKRSLRKSFGGATMKNRGGDCCV